MTEWKVGDLFVFNQANPSGGVQFGTIGDVGEILSIEFRQRNYAQSIARYRHQPEFVDLLYFKFVSLNKDEPEQLEQRSDYLRMAEEGAQPVIHIHSYAASPINKEYSLDQELDAGEDLL